MTTGMFKDGAMYSSSVALCSVGPHSQDASGSSDHEAVCIRAVLVRLHAVAHRALIG